MLNCRIVNARVRGRVQGIGFRAWVQRQAELKGLEGWVRNRRDGTVEAVLAGDPETVGIMLDALSEGPQGSRVDAVEVEEGGEQALAPRPASRRFAVLGTV